MGIGELAGEAVIIYIAGPYRATSEWGVTENIRRAEEAAIAVWKLGHVALCPHKNTAYFGGICPDETWLQGDLELLTRCDAVYFIPGWEKSSGCRVEHERAIWLDIPIFLSLEAIPRRYPT